LHEDDEFHVVYHWVILITVALLGGLMMMIVIIIITTIIIRIVYRNNSNISSGQVVLITIVSMITVWFCGEVGKRSNAFANSVIYARTMCGHRKRSDTRENFIFFDPGVSACAATTAKYTVKTPKTCENIGPVWRVREG
jgi:hypothetical protein